MPGERLLWSGRPRRIRILTPSDLLLMPAALLLERSQGLLGNSGDSAEDIMLALRGVAFLVLGVYSVSRRLLGGPLAHLLWPDRGTRDHRLGPLLEERQVREPPRSDLRLPGRKTGWERPHNLRSQVPGFVVGQRFLAGTR